MARPVRIEFEGALYHVMGKKQIGQALHEEVVQRKFDPLTGPDRKLVGQANRTCYCKKLPE